MGSGKVGLMGVNPLRVSASLTTPKSPLGDLNAGTKSVFGYSKPEKSNLNVI